MRAPEALRSTLFLAAALLLLAACSSSGLRKERTGIQVTPVREVRTSADERARRESSLALYQAGRARDDNDLALAIKLAGKALAVSPGSFDALMALGLLLSETGDAAGAEKMYRQVLARDPVHADASNNYGGLLCKQDMAAEALVIFDRALEAGGSDFHTGLLANAGTCALRAGQLERSERDFRRTLELEPENAQALFGMAKLQLERGQLLSARAFYQRCMAAAPQSDSVLQLAIEVEQALGDVKAVEHFRQLLKTRP